MNLQQQSYEQRTWQRAAYGVPYLERSIVRITPNHHKVKEGNLPPVDLRAVCLVRAIVKDVSVVDVKV